MNPHDRNAPDPLDELEQEGKTLLTKLLLYLLYGVACFVAGHMIGEVRGFAAGQATIKCRQPTIVPLSERTRKQQIAYFKWIMRPQEVVK